MIRDSNGFYNGSKLCSSYDKKLRIDNITRNEYWKSFVKAQFQLCDFKPEIYYKFLSPNITSPSELHMPQNTALEVEKGVRPILGMHLNEPPEVSNRVVSQDTQIELLEDEKGACSKLSKPLNEPPEGVKWIFIINREDIVGYNNDSRGLYIHPLLVNFLCEHINYIYAGYVSYLMLLINECSELKNQSLQETIGELEAENEKLKRICKQSNAGFNHERGGTIIIRPHLTKANQYKLIFKYSQVVEENYQRCSFIYPVFNIDRMEGLIRFYKHIQNLSKERSNAVRMSSISTPKKNTAQKFKL